MTPDQPQAPPAAADQPVPYTLTAKAEAGPDLADQPVPYTLTSKAAVELADAERSAQATAAALDEFYGRRPGTAARLFVELAGPDPEVTWEAVAEAVDNWDSFDSDAYQARVEAGLEPEAGQ